MLLKAREPESDTEHDGTSESHGSGGLRQHPGRGAATGLPAGADRQRELRISGGPGGHGYRPHQQIRRGPSSQTLLRWLRTRRCGGGPRPGTREDPLRRRPRQRSTPCRRSGQHGGLLRFPEARRSDPGDGPQPRRPPHPWLAGELQWVPVSGRGIRGRRGRWAHRLRCPEGEGPDGTAQAHHRRSERLPPGH